MRTSISVIVMPIAIRLAVAILGSSRCWPARLALAAGDPEAAGTASAAGPLAASLPAGSTPAVAETAPAAPGRLS